MNTIHTTLPTNHNKQPKQTQIHKQKLPHRNLETKSTAKSTANQDNRKQLLINTINQITNNTTKH